MSDSWEDAVTDASQLAGGADSDGGRGHVHGSRVSGDRVDRGRVGGATGTASGYVSGHRIDGGGTPHNARGGGAGDGVGGGGTSHDAGGVGAEGFDGPTASVGASSSLVDGSNGDRRGDGTSDVRRRSGRVSPLPEGIDRMPAGVELARVCTEVDVASCNGYELEAVIAGLRRVIRWLEASCLTAVAELAHARGGGGPDADPGRLDEPDPDASALLEPLLCWTGHAAARYTAIALILTRYAPNTLTALRDGRIELAAARVIAERMLWLETDQLRHRLDQVIFPDAYTIPAVLPLRDYIEHQIITLDPEAAQRRRHHAINSRGFDLFPTTDGAANLRVRDIPAEHAAEAAAYVDAIARSMKATGDTRTLQQLKADIATALLSGTATITPCNGHTTHPNPDTDTASDVDRDVAQDPTRSANARLESVSARLDSSCVSAGPDRDTGRDRDADTPAASAADSSTQTGADRDADIDLDPSVHAPVDTAPAETVANTDTTTTGVAAAGVGGCVHNQCAHDVDHPPGCGCPDCTPPDPHAWQQVWNTHYNNQAATALPATTSNGDDDPGTCSSPKTDSHHQPPPQPPPPQPVPPTPPPQPVLPAQRQPHQPDTQPAEHHHDGDRQQPWHAHHVRGVRARITMTVPLTTLARLSQQPATLAGVGPIVAEAARQITLNHLDNPNATYSLAITHPHTGQLLSLHPMPHRYLRGLHRHLIQTLHQHCTFTYCRQPAETCDIDHTTPYHHTHTTTPTDTSPLCRRHHRLKTNHHWTLTQPQPGYLVWTDPHGRTYTTTPPPLTHPTTTDDFDLPQTKQPEDNEPPPV